MKAFSKLHFFIVRLAECRFENDGFHSFERLIENIQKRSTENWRLLFLIYIFFSFSSYSFFLFTVLSFCFILCFLFQYLEYTLNIHFSYFYFCPLLHSLFLSPIFLFFIFIYLLLFSIILFLLSLSFYLLKK